MKPRNRAIGLSFKGNEFVTIKIRVVQLLPDAEKLQRIAISHPAIDQVRFQGVAERLFLNLSGLSERRRRAVAHVQEYGKISTGEFAHLSGISERAARKHLSAMADEEVLIYHAAGPKSHYTLHPHWTVRRSSG